MGCATDDKAKASTVKMRNEERIWTVCDARLGEANTSEHRGQVLYNDDYSIREPNLAC